MASCVFYRTAPAGSCDLHHALGHPALPLACQQFPRMSVTAGGRTSVTLSHYCPTARALLDSSSTVSIVEEPPQAGARLRRPDRLVTGRRSYDLDCS
jgi:hypothetical protein